MEDLNDDFENNNFDNYDNDNDTDSLDDSDDECTYARFDFESFDLDEFLRRLDSPTPNRKRSLYEAPEFVQRLNAFEEVRAGSTVVFECKWKGCPKPSVKWYKDDEEITENPRYSITEENDGSLKLTIEEACKEDEGAYKVKAENSEGVSSSTGYLSVTGDVSERPLAAQPRKNLDYSVSFPPHLRTIVEQKSLEEREEEELSNLPPSPIQGYIDSFRRGKLGPLFPGCTVPSYADDEGDSINQDDSDSDTSVESQTFDEELFITEEDDINTSQASDPLLPAREKPLEMSLDYSKITQDDTPGGNICPKEQSGSRTENTPGETPRLRFTTEIHDIELSPDSRDHKLAEHFDEFMKSKRKEVDEIVSYSGPEQCAVETPFSSNGYNENPAASASFQSNFETLVSDSTKLPDIIQTIPCGNNENKMESAGIEDKYLSTAFMNMPNYDPESGNLELRLEDEILKNSSFVSEIDRSPTATSDLNEAKNTEDQLRATQDLPWLCYLGLASGSTFLASCTNMSPFYFVLLWVAISFLSFRFCVHEERLPAPNI